MRSFRFVVSLAVALASVGARAQSLPNDEASGAIPVGLGLNPGGEGNYFTNEGSTSSEAYPPLWCGLSPHSDVWFSFTPTTTGLHVVSLCPPAGYAPGTMYDTVLGVYDASATALLACAEDGCSVPTPAGLAYHSLASVGLAAGVPVRIRVASRSQTNRGRFYLTIVDSSAGAGSDCATAPTVGDGVWFGDLTNDVPSGFIGGGTCSSFSATTPDMYYRYVAAATGSAQVYLDGGGLGARLAVYDFSASVCGAETLLSGLCGASRMVTFPVTSGGVYLLRFGLAFPATTPGSGANLFSIRILPSAPPPNDVCAGALPLALGDNLMTTIGATPEPAIPAACPFGAFTPATNNDVWGVYTSTGPGLLRFGCSGTGAQQVSVYAGSCGALTSLGCATGTPLTPVSVPDLVGGTTYYVRAGTTTAALRTPVNLWVQQVPISVNDECAGALPLVEGLNLGDTLGASFSSTTPVGTCTAITTSSHDLWYTFAAPTTCTVVLQRRLPDPWASTGITRLALYSGSCGSLTTVACGTTSIATVVPPGVYYVRAVQVGVGGVGPFGLYFQCAGALANDECAGATPIDVGFNLLSTGGMTPSAAPLASCPASFAFTPTTPDAWFSYTPATDGVLMLRQTDGVGVDRLALYDGSNGCAGAQLACAGGVIDGVPATAGVPFLIRAGVGNSANQGFFTLDLRLITNDDCAHALPLSLGVNGPLYNAGTASAPDVGFGVGECAFGTGSYHDVFFTYTATCDGRLTASTCEGDYVATLTEIVDTKLAVYDAWSCGVGPIGPAYACNDDAVGVVGCGPNGAQSSATFAVVAGHVYLIRVGTASANVTGSFYLTLTLTTASLSPIGTGCGPGPVPTLSGDGPPQFGATRTFAVQAQPSAFGALLGAPANPAAVYAPFGPCTIYLLQPGLVFLLPIGTDLTGSWSVTATFPAYDPALDCSAVELQAVVMGPGGIEFTNALRLVVGS